MGMALERFARVIGATKRLDEKIKAQAEELSAHRNMRSVDMMQISTLNTVMRGLVTKADAAWDEVGKFSTKLEESQRALYAAQQQAGRDAQEIARLKAEQDLDGRLLADLNTSMLQVDTLTDQLTDAQLQIVVLKGELADRPERGADGRFVKKSTKAAAQTFVKLAEEQGQVPAQWVKELAEGEVQ